MVISTLLRSPLVLLALLCNWLCLAEQPGNLPRPTTYVADFAGVVDNQSKANVEDLCRQVYEKAHATIVVVTVNSLDGATIEDFTTRLEDSWKVGPKNSDRGVLLVFAIQDRKRRIEVGYGLEGVLNDAKVGDIGRAMVPQLRAGQYGAAIQSGVEAIANVIAADAGVTLQPPAVQHTYHREAAQRSGRGGGTWIWLLLVLFFLFFAGRGGRSGLLWFLLGSMMGGGGRGGRWGDGSGGGFGGDSGSGGGGGGGPDDGSFGGGSGGGGASGDW